ncbi:MAG: M48 family metalloprotease [Burkholderiales bacterium]|nr:M48 family metalloprotease [Phycisphaerae bacterium]
MQRPSDRWIDRNGGLASGPDVDRLRRAAAPIVAAGGVPVRLSVVATPALGAWSWPDGSIFVSRGLLHIVTDAELAAIVGHEIGHLSTQTGATRQGALSETSGDLATESAADEFAVRLLDRNHLPKTAMRTALQKLLSLSDATESRDGLDARLAKLP